MNAIVESLARYRLVPVIEIDQAKQAEPLARLLVECGLPVAEVTLRSAEALDALDRMKRSQPELLIGAGTVLTADQAVQAKEAGADFLVSPGLNPIVVHKAMDLNLPMIPGVNNPSHIEQAMSLGLSAIKFFPAEASGGVAFLKAILAPYKGLSVMPTGGINADNLKDYLSIPQVFACGGSWFVKKELIQQGDFEQIKHLLQHTLQGVNQIKG